MEETSPKRQRKRRRKFSANGGALGAGGHEADRRPSDEGPDSPQPEGRRALEGEYERDAGAQRELEELERAEREQRELLEGHRAPGRRNAEE